MKPLAMRRGLLAVAAASLVGVLAACSTASGTTPTAGAGASSPGSSAAGAASDGQQITLTVGLFGSFGYKEAGLYDEYMKQHPNIKIVETSPQQETDYWNALETHLAGGSGLSDIQAIEVGRIASVTANQADAFVDLNTLPGGADVIKEFLPWKEGLATTKDGNVLALGTDIGPLSMCYKPALLKAAGLPTDPVAVGKLWTSWGQYVEVGKKFMASAPKGTTWTDSAAGLFRAAMGVTGEKYTDANGNLIYETNPVVKQTFQLTAQAVEDKETAALTQFTPAWNQSFSTNAYATLACPAWMLTYIKGQAGTAGKNQWAVTNAPTPGNVGGAYLAIPKASQHQAEAWDLIKFLTSATSQGTVFKQAGNFPSNVQAEAAIKGYTDPYFNNSPTGKVLGDSAANLPKQVVGPHDNDIETAFMNAANSMAQSGTSEQDAWNSALQNIKAAVGG
jgi:cellobiose transport system substrate-binding protein